jgi:hypothetical protein
VLLQDNGYNSDCSYLQLRPDGLGARLPSRSSGCFESTLQGCAKTPSAACRQDTGIDAVRRWNEIAINASGLDHTPVTDGETRVFGEQIGPARSSRAMAIVHIAIFDVVAAISGGYRSYTGISRGSGDASMHAAIAQAAHDTLRALFPSQAQDFAAALAEDLQLISGGRAKHNGVDLGRRAATAILERRTNDGSEHAEPRVSVDYITSDDPGK